MERRHRFGHILLRQRQPLQNCRTSFPLPSSSAHRSPRAHPHTFTRAHTHVHIRADAGLCACTHNTCNMCTYVQVQACSCVRAHTCNVHAHTHITERPREMFPYITGLHQQQFPQGSHSAVNLTFSQSLWKAYCGPNTALGSGEITVKSSCLCGVYILEQRRPVEHPSMRAMSRIA